MIKVTVNGGVVEEGGPRSVSGMAEGGPWEFLLPALWPQTQNSLSPNNDFSLLRPPPSLGCAKLPVSPAGMQQLLL